MGRLLVVVLLLLPLFGVVAPRSASYRPLIQITEAIKQHLLAHASHHAQVPQKIGADLPTNFDGRQAWPGCIGQVLDQGNCGSCWAFAASEVLSDRYCIHSTGKVKVTLSPQNLLSCEELNLGCLMGSLPSWAWSFMQETGITTIQCVPYVSGDGSDHPCTDDSMTCTNTSSSFHLYKASNYTQVGSFIDPSLHVDAIMRALLQGPVDATFNVFSDFDSYSGGVYSWQWGSYEGLHSVKIIGWGVDYNEKNGTNGVPYWLVQNSWGKWWGPYGGYFKILRGVDECGIESLVYTGFPLF
jgi:cathepsin B